jgi:hypothetical protein
LVIDHPSRKIGVFTGDETFQCDDSVLAIVPQAQDIGVGLTRAAKSLRFLLIKSKVKSLIRMIIDSENLLPHRARIPYLAAIASPEL